MKKILSTIVLSSLVTLSISPPVKAHKVKSYKQCEKWARNHLDMGCSEAVGLGLIVIAIEGGNMPASGE